MSELARTIVGGRSVRFPWSVNAPRGIEVLLKKAKVDVSFRRHFLQNPVAAADLLGLNLTDSEQLVLANSKPAMIGKMIDCVSVPRQHEKVFRGARVAAMIGLVIAASSALPPYVWSTGSMEMDESVPVADVQPLMQEELGVTQVALEQYFQAHGTYPNTIEWLRDDPLGEYTDTLDPHNAWYLRFRYRGIADADGAITNYALIAALAALIEPEAAILVASGDERITSVEGIGPPLDTFEHAFWDPQPLKILFPRTGTTVENTDDGIVFEVTHQDPDSLVYWFFDGEQIGETTGEHVMSMPASTPGTEHWLVVVDEEINYAAVPFTILVPAE